MKVVEFKTRTEFYGLEMDGAKPNTNRVIDVKDERFKSLRSGDAERIIIRERDNDGWFMRRITDYTEYEGRGTISWQHPVQLTSTTSNRLIA